MLKQFTGTWYVFILFIVAQPVLHAQNQNATDQILELFNIVNLAYVDSFDQKKLSEAAINAMLAELDPHSVYIPKEEVDVMNESLKGNYEGIGIQFDLFRDTVLVVSPVPGGPADLLGIQSGDKIIRAEGQFVAGVGIKEDEIIQLLKGKQGTQVAITIKRPGVPKPIEYLITREKIPIFSVDVGYMIDDKTGLIKINRFSRNTMDEFLSELENLKKNNLENLILDLRGNGGGYLYSAVDLVDEFIDDKKIIVTTQGMRQSPREYRSKPKGAFTEGRLIVLINEGTASASEIVAGAIQDLDRGLIIGRRSFGKGLVMKPYSLSDGSVVRLTTSRYYTPSGRCIQKDYDHSKSKYEEEINERYKNGEMFSLDSIAFPEDLKFNTSLRRIVYGGGGIMPDIFVPVDTNLVKEDFQKIFKSGAFNIYSTKYVEKHRSELVGQFKNVADLLVNDQINAELIQGLNTYLMEDSILTKPLAPEFNPLATTQIKAFMARHLWDDRAYNVAINHNQKIIKESLLLIKNEKFNWKELSFHSK